MWDWQRGHCVFFLTHLLRQGRWYLCMHSILATRCPSSMRLRQIAQFSSPRLFTTSHSMRFLFALACSFPKSTSQLMPSPTFSVQQSREQCTDPPSSVQSFNSGCCSPLSSCAFWARVRVRPTAKRQRYLRRRKEDSVMLTSLCLNWRCSYSRRMMRAMQTRERRKREREGKTCSSRQQLMKSEPFTEAISTAFTETSFIQIPIK